MNRSPAVFLVFVAATLIACGRSQPSRSDQSASTVAPAAVTAEEKALLALLPASGAVPDWSRANPPRRYSEADLWEYIDGAAEAYLAFGFQELATARYSRTAAGIDATADIFKMADPVNAFGIFAQERSAGCEEVPVGVEGCYAGGVLTFWSGPYFVKLTAFKESAEIRRALISLAGSIASTLGSPGTIPPQVNWFPPKNLVSRSVKYVPKDALGQSYLVNAFEAQYKDGAASPKLTVMVFDSAEVAARAIADYMVFIGSAGKTTRDFSPPGGSGFTGTDGYYGTVVAARSGSSVAIALGVPSEKAGTALIEACFARMKGPR